MKPLFCTIDFTTGEFIVARNALGIVTGAR